MASLQLKKKIQELFVFFFWFFNLGLLITLTCETWFTHGWLVAACRPPRGKQARGALVEIRRAPPASHPLPPGSYLFPTRSWRCVRAAKLLLTVLRLARTWEKKRGGGGGGGGREGGECP